jgi:dihydrofolate synthase/folylpolyglutamate synthase
VFFGYGVGVKTDKNSSNLEEALKRLYLRRQFGIKLGLDPVRRMCGLLGNPENSFGVIHVAGTNGKGSVCAMAASIIQAAGIKTGLYTSPHLVRFNERIRINGEELSDDELAEALADCEAAANQVKSEQNHEATFFEITTVLAFECFRRAGVKLAVIETGLGGRLDATNVVTPLVSVITGISKDHTLHLGDSLKDIAIEKAGIIKSGRPVVLSPQDKEDTTDILRDIAAERQAPLTIAAEAVCINRISGDMHGQKLRFDTADGIGGTARLPLAGNHQLENLGVAITAADILFGMLGVPLESVIIKKGIENIRWSGRCQVLKDDPLVIVDAAHNPAGAKVLAQTLKRNGIKHAGFILGVCDDKDSIGIVKQLAAVAGMVWVTPIDNERNIPQEKLLNIVKSFGIEVQATDSVEQALAAAEKWAESESLPIVIAGSLFLLGEVLKKA